MKTILFNPFEKYSEKQLLIFGVLTSIIGGFLAFQFNGRFDGIIDLHFVEKTTFKNIILDLVIDFITLSFVLFIIGKFINKKTRYIDLLTPSLIAKIPFYFMLFFNIDNKMYQISEKLIENIAQNKLRNIDENDILLLMFSAIATLVILVWSILLLFNGFKIATNSKETKHVLLFVLALILAEIISKFLIFKFN